jgi:hypothetical protein
MHGSTGGRGANSCGSVALGRIPPIVAAKNLVVCREAEFGIYGLEPWNGTISGERISRSSAPGQGKGGARGLGGRTCLGTSAEYLSVFEPLGQMPEMRRISTTGELNVGCDPILSHEINYG